MYLVPGGGVSGPGGGVPGPGGGVYLVLGGVPGPRGGVPGPGGVYLVPGGVPGPGGGRGGEGGCTWPWGGYLVRYSPPPVNRMTNRCKNITLLQTSFAGGKYRCIQLYSTDTTWIF